MVRLVLPTASSIEAVTTVQRVRGMRCVHLTNHLKHRGGYDNVQRHNLRTELALTNRLKHRGGYDDVGARRPGPGHRLTNRLKHRGGYDALAKELSDSLDLSPTASSIEAVTTG